MRVFTIILVASFALACGKGNAGEIRSNQTTPSFSPTPIVVNTSPSESNCKGCDFDYGTYKGDLKKEEVAGLLLALDDEYLAFATYDQINKDFNNPRPFSNIQQAEAKHSERLKQLFVIHKIDIPENLWLGTAPKFASFIEACKAGIEAEKLNIRLYDNLFKSTSREDILTVYRALQSASQQNHLPAFQRCAEVIGAGRGNRF